MKSRKIACVTAAISLGVGLSGFANASAATPGRDVVVKGERIDPALQRTVSYADLNLAFSREQGKLRSRIFSTARDLCWDLNGAFAIDRCTDEGVDSTNGQVAQAIIRAKRQMAGLPVGPAIAISMVVGSR
jgi:UrcA family protein